MVPKAQGRLLTELEWHNPSSRSRRIGRSHEEQVSFEIWLLIGRPHDFSAHPDVARTSGVESW